MGIGRKRSNADFGKRLLKLIPGIRDARPSLETAPGVVKRIWCYDMPSLEECRAAFDKCVGQPVDWPALSPGEGERAENSPPPEFRQPEQFFSDLTRLTHRT
jgi:hypothetical protein